MASSLTHVPTSHTGPTLSPDEWIRSVWDAISGGPYTQRLVASDGMMKPVRYAAVLFRGFQSAGPRGYKATPTAIVDFREAFSATLDGRENRWGARRGDVLVPLGLLGVANTECRTVLQQCARQWVTGGAIGFGGNMSDENVVTMYYAALQCLVFETVSGKDENVRQWFDATLALIRALKKLCDESEIARNVSKALATTCGADDMLQRAIASLYVPDFVWSDEFKLELLETVVRRSRRSRTVGLDAGPFAVFTLVPLLREGVINMEGWGVRDYAVFAEFNKRTTALLNDYIEGASSDKDAMMISSLHTLASKGAGVPVSKDDIRRLLTHIQTHPEVDDAAPWAEWGVLPPPPRLDCNVIVYRWGIAGEHTASYRAKVTPTSPTTFRVQSYKGTEWCAIQLKTNGTYTVQPTNLGLAVAAKGSSLGQELMANWRVTLGGDVLPKDYSGISAAGMTYNPTTGRYARTQEPFDMARPFVVEISDTGVLISQTGAAPFNIVRRQNYPPPLLAFKNVLLDVRFAATPPPPSPLDLPPTMLLAKLRELAAQ